MLKEWREDFTSGKLTLAMIEAKKRSKGTDGAMSLKSIPIRKDLYFTDYLLRWLEIIQADVEEDTFAGYWRTVHNPLLPYFSEHNATLEELSAVDLTLFYKYCKTDVYKRQILNIVFRYADVQHPEAKFDRAAHHALAAELEKECAVLLQNKGCLLYTSRCV